MSTDIPEGNKFACLALEGPSVSLNGELMELPSGLKVMTTAPFEITGHWEEWLGSILLHHLRRCDLAFVVQASAREPEVINEENSRLEREVTAFLYGLLLIGLPHIEGGLILAGANVSDEIQVRTVGQIQPVYRSAQTLPAHVSSGELQAADSLRGALLDFYVEQGSSRLKRGFDSWLRGIHEERGSERLHMFVRALDGVIATERGQGKAQFKSRASTLANATPGSDELLGELYDLRSCAEHLRELDCGLEHVQEGNRDRHANLRAHQSELLSSFAYERILLNEELRGWFHNPQRMSEFWNKSPAERDAIWGNSINLEQSAEIRFRG